MRILIINKLAWPWIGGIERHVDQLIGEFRHDPSLTITLLTISQNNLFSDEREGNVRIIQLPNLCFRLTGKVLWFSMPVSLQFFRWFRRLSREHDIIHLHLPFPLAVLALPLVRPQIPIIVTWHSDIVKQKRMLTWYRPLEIAILRRWVNRIMTTSPQMILHSSFLPTLQDRCSVVPLGIDYARFALTAQVRKKVTQLRQSLTQPLLLFVGRFSYYKGLPYLIEALRQLPDLHCWLIGSGELATELSAMLDRYQLHAQVRIIPPVSDAELIAYYYACDIFVLPSIASSEAYGLVQLEAMACAKPVISTNLPTGVPFVNEHGRTGIIVEPADASALTEGIRTLLNMDYRQMGEYARQRVEKMFTLPAMAHQVRQHYQELFEPPPSSEQG